MSSKTTEMLDNLSSIYNKKLDMLMVNGLLIDAIAKDLGSVIGGFEPSEYGTCLDLICSGKRQDLNFIWSVLRRLGFATDSRPATGEATYSGYWKAENTEMQIWLYFSSTECKLVQTGTKMVEQAVYEVQCNSELAELGV
jgi:hypothetical protein